MVTAVFLDRDGVINANIERDGRMVAPTSIEQFEFLPGVEDAVRRLKAAGFVVVVVTNQPDVSTGRSSRATLDAMHEMIRSRMPIDDIKACVHVESDGCDCRKPKPGMILQAAKQFGIDLAASYMVGDRWRDIDAGRAAGCVTILVNGASEQDRQCEPDKAVPSLPDAVDYILEHQPGAAS